MIELFKIDFSRSLQTMPIFLTLNFLKCLLDNKCYSYGILWNKTFGVIILFFFKYINYIYLSLSDFI